MTGWRVADSVAWLEVPHPETPVGSEVDEAPPAPGEVLVARVPQGPPMALRGSSALIWLAVVEGGGTDDEVVHRVARSSGQPAAVVGDDVRVLLVELSRLGVLAHQPEPT